MPDLQSELNRWTQAKTDWIEHNINDLLQIYPELLEAQDNDELVQYYLDLHCPD